MEEIIGKKFVFSPIISQNWQSKFPSLNIAFIETCFDRFNDRLSLFKYLSIEDINLRLGIESNADEIDSTKCLRYDGRKVKPIYDSLSDSEIIFHFEWEE